MERHTLRLLQFNINVPFAVYARYYFDLLTIGEKLGYVNQISERQRLTTDLARKFHLIPFTVGDQLWSNQRSLFDLPNVFVRDFKPLHQRKEIQAPVNSNHRKFVKTPYVSKCLLLNKDKNFNDCKKVVQKPFQESKCDNAPIELDEESEFINSIKFESNDSYFIGINSNNKTNSKFSFVSKNHTKRLPDCDLLYNEDFVNCLARTTHLPTAVSSSHTTFIQSLMGGEVACSLLRDTGMY